MPVSTEFEDAESYSFNYLKDRLSFRDLILLHVKKIAQLACVEFRGGYWEVREIPVVKGNAGYTLKNTVYIPDTRECYSNAVECLADMLAPYFDKEMSEAEKKTEKNLEEAHKSNTVYVEPTKSDQNENESEQTEYEQEGYRAFKDNHDKIQYRDVRVQINRRLFRALCCFLYRKKYLELGSLED